MVNIASLCDEVIKLLNDRKDENYRICVIIVGPPGSGKSTIATELCLKLNCEYNDYLRNHPDISIKPEKHSSIDLASDIPNITPELRECLESSGGIFKDLVEDTSFVPIKQKLENGVIEVIGRGGKPNCFTICESELKEVHSNTKTVDIAQIIPMDGFHLSRNCLDCFKDPKQAHERRGSPWTFDSNNFLQLCEVLSKTSLIKPNKSLKKNCFEFISETFIENLPVIKIPSFDHSLKDPTPNDYSVDGFTRIMIFEGLYLLYNQENWKHVYEELLKTNALLVWNVDIEEGIIQERVGKRHLQTGIVTTLDDGIKRFQMNDLLNARIIRENSIHNENIINIRND